MKNVKIESCFLGREQDRSKERQIWKNRTWCARSQAGGTLLTNTLTGRSINRKTLQGRTHSGTGFVASTDVRYECGLQLQHADFEKMFPCCVFCWIQIAIERCRPAFLTNLPRLSLVSPFICCQYPNYWLLYMPPSLTFNNSTFCPHSVFMCFVWIWEQTAIISLYNIKWLVFITEI